MATNDVPGANPMNQDELRVGCWAEHEDGSLIFVKSVEGNRVIYEMYDVSSTPIIQYTDAMPEDGFKQQFSYKPAQPNSVCWSWHDKTGFPWDRVIKNGARDGMNYASAQDQLAAAARVARSLQLRGRNFNPDSIQHMVETLTPSGSGIISKIQEAINSLPVDDEQSLRQRRILEKAQIDVCKAKKRKKILGIF